jgi:hypothetical protein
MKQQNFTKDSTIDRDLKLHPNYKQIDWFRNDK